MFLVSVYVLGSRQIRHWWYAQIQNTICRQLCLSRGNICTRQEFGECDLLRTCAPGRQAARISIWVLLAANRACTAAGFFVGEQYGVGGV